MRLSRKSLIVARWEFIERAKKKSFIIGLFLTPAIMVLFGAGPALLQFAIKDTASLKIAVYDETGIVFDSLSASLSRKSRLADGSPKFMLQRLPTDRPYEALKGDLDSSLLSGSLHAAVFIPEAVIGFNSAAESGNTDSAGPPGSTGTLGDANTHNYTSAPGNTGPPGKNGNLFDARDETAAGDVEYRSRNVSDIEHITMLERRISRIIAEQRLAHAGLDPDRVRDLNRFTEMKTVRVSETGEKESGFLESFGLSYVFLFMLLFIVLFSGQMLVRSLVEEKSNRIIEVLVSSCSPIDLMLGKLLGISGLAFVQVTFWSLIAIVVVAVTGLTNLPLEHIWLMVLYFVLGFLLYASVFVMFGCLVSTEQEAQQITGYLSMVVMLPILIAFIATQSPNSPFLVVLSMIPFLTPQMMFVRLPITSPPTWEIALSLLILLVSIFFMTWIAAKIFRTGILLTGKRPALNEIARWIRS